MKKEHMWLVGKFVVILIMLALLFVKKQDAQSIGIGVGVIVGMIVISFFRIKYPDRYKSDERLERLSGKATLWSWTASFIIVILLYWLSYLEYINLSGTLLISIIFWAMVISIVSFRIYLLRKGDVK